MGHALPQQPRDPMHDHARLARAGTGEHQQTAVGRGGDDGLLGGVAQIDQDAPMGRFRGGDLQDLLASGEMAADELAAFQAEVIGDELHRGLDLDRPEPRVLAHDMHLNDLVAVVQVEFGVIALAELAAAGLAVERDVHRRTEERLAAREFEDFVGVQIEQRGRERPVPILDLQILEREIPLQGVLKVALLEHHL